MEGQRRLRRVHAHLVGPAAAAGAEPERPVSKLVTGWAANGTVGQPQPFAANNGDPWVKYADRPDGGSAVAAQFALEWMGTRKPRLLDSAPERGPIDTPYGVGFRSYSECLEYIQSGAADVPKASVEGEVVVPLSYNVHEEPSYSMVPSHQIWEDEPEKMKELMRSYGPSSLYFPQLMRDGRRVASYRPHLKIDTLQAFDELGICCLTTPSDIGSYCWDDHTRVRQQYYRECEELLLSFFPGSTSAYVFDHELRDKVRDRQLINSFFFSTDPYGNTR
jgi:hypothetical protein